MPNVATLTTPLCARYNLDGLKKCDLILYLFESHFVIVLFIFMFIFKVHEKREITFVYRKPDIHIFGSQTFWYLLCYNRYYYLEVSQFSLVLRLIWTKVYKMNVAYYKSVSHYRSGVKSFSFITSRYSSECEVGRHTVI